MRTFAGAGLVMLLAMAPGAAGATALSGSDRGAWAGPGAATPGTSARADVLDSVSCKRAGHCIAVGYKVVGPVRIPHLAVQETDQVGVCLSVPMFPVGRHALRYTTSG